MVETIIIAQAQVSNGDTLKSTVKYVPVRLTNADVKAFTKAMKKSEHKTLSGWIRHILKKAVND